MNRFRIVLTLALLPACALAQWPQWGGPERDFQTANTLADAWPEGGPRVRRRAGESDLGAIGDEPVAEGADRVEDLHPEEAPELPSVVDLYASADWMEREVYDMYGVRFTGHPKLERILLYEEFEGYPLRKDYAKERRQPLVGPRN